MWPGTVICRAAAGLVDPRDHQGACGTHRNIKALVLRMARENLSLGYRRIHGELAGLGVKVAPSTVWEILKRAGIDPATGRDAGSRWATFLRSQAGAIIAREVVDVDLLDGSKAYMPAMVEHATRRVRIPGATRTPPSARRSTPCSPPPASR